MTTNPSENSWSDEDCDEKTVALLGSYALAKACQDDCFDYALKLRTGEVIRFTGARVISPEWIHLDVMLMRYQPDQDGLPYKADRGIDVRIADIVWVMDAPEGS